MSSRVTIVYDDGTRTDFLELSDALFHATQQGTAGVVGVNDEEGSSILTRKQLDAKVASVIDESSVDSSPENRVKAARKIAKES